MPCIYCAPKAHTHTEKQVSLQICHQKRPDLGTLLPLARGAEGRTHWPQVEDRSRGKRPRCSFSPFSQLHPSLKSSLCPYRGAVRSNFPYRGAMEGRPEDTFFPLFVKGLNSHSMSYTVWTKLAVGKRDKWLSPHHSLKEALKGWITF